MSISLKSLVETFKIKPNASGPTRAKTPVARTSYAYVFEPKETPSGDMKYGICLIFKKADKAEWKDVAQAIVNAAAKKFGEDSNKWPKTLKCPMRDGDDRDGKEYENSIFINSGNKNKPGIIDRSLNPIMDHDEFYSGCYARASISFYSFDKKGNKGVGSGLNNLLLWGDGERLDGTVTAEDEFSEFKSDEVADDDISF